MKGSQFMLPLFEYSGACAGCGETPYVKLLTQLFGDRLIIANATGCSSIYGGNLPTTPYCVDSNGRGPAWANSLFEDNAEFGLGMRLAIDRQTEFARELTAQLSGQIGENLVRELLNADQSQRSRHCRSACPRDRACEPSWRPSRPARPQRLDVIADYLVKKSVWILGGDGWAYDIGYGGLDHVLATGHDVNFLVMDTEVYSNTGGQASKATPMGASAKFASAGKTTPKKDMAMIAMSYGNIYVAKVAFGAKDVQTVKAFQEAESYKGASLVLAYAHCIAHGYDMQFGTEQQKLAVDSGHWPLFRFDPRLAREGHAAAAARLDPAQDQADAVREERNTLPHGRADEPRWVQEAHGPGAVRRRQALDALRADEQAAGVQGRDRGDHPGRAPGHRKGREPQGLIGPVRVRRRLWS